LNGKLKEGIIFTKMASKPFQFKYFSVAQDLCAHKVGTDGVLLGAWVNIGTETSILDIGTGSGLIALMLAQRTQQDARIDAIDIEAAEVQQAKENVLQSPWSGKISVQHAGLQEFFPEHRYELIVSNPPYFVNSLLPPDKKRRQARHTCDLSFEDLLQNTSRLLTPQGKFALILPYPEGLRFIVLAKDFGLFPLRDSTFRSRSEKPFERLLIEFSRRRQEPEHGDLILYDTGNRWSETYKKLTREFYLQVDAG
jgi:tRNA1Val (adenine37-N6)-methyltransferase